MNSAQNPKYNCLSPFAILEELEEFVRAVSNYEFLKQEPLSGGFHENRKFIFQTRDRLLDQIDEEVRTSMGLVEERRTIEQFERYVTHVSYWTKKEKVPNPITRRDEDPDENFMGDVERSLDVSSPGKREEYRREIISKIGAWSIDHPGRKPDYEAIFPRAIAELREVFFTERKKQVRKINEDLLVMLVDGPGALRPEAVAAATKTLTNLRERFGYCDSCAKDAVLALMRKRYNG
jgi:predicted Ser/Thr protein kinase